MPRFFRFQCVVKLINLREFEGRNLSSPWSTYKKKTIILLIMTQGVVCHNKTYD